MSRSWVRLNSSLRRCRRQIAASLFMETYDTAFLVPAWKLHAVHMLGLACLGVAMGAWLQRTLPLLDRLNIPTPIPGV
jgi:hypothetical protein